MPAKRRIDATQAMAEAEAALTRAGVKFVRHSPFHLKVQVFNFWPSTGKISRDDSSKKGDNLGLAVFIRMLREAGLAKGQPLDAVDVTAAFVVQLPSQEPGFETW